MKKAGIYIGIFISFIIIYILQSNFFTWFNIAGIQPNLFIILILFCGLYTDKKSGMIVGVILGIFLDLFIQTKVIISPIMLGILGFISGIIQKNFSKGNKLNIMIMVATSTFFFEFGSYLLRIMIYSVGFEIVPFIKIILIEIIFNVMITIIVYPLIQFFGKKIENILFGNEILRYF